MEWVNRLLEEYGVNILYDVFLRDNDSVYFLVEGSHIITDKKLIRLYGSCKMIGTPKCAKTIDELLMYIDCKSEICDIRGAKQYLDELRRAINSDQTKTVLYLPLDFGSGMKKYLELKIFKMFERDVSIVVVNQIDMQKVNVETLYFESYKDSLTNLFNYSTLLLHLDKTTGNHFFGFIDIDYFKIINDTYGHKVGDEVLAEIGHKLIDVSDEHVIMYRKSGDEFIFMTLDLDAKQTRALAERIQEAIRSIKLPNIDVDCSIGVVEYRDGNGFFDVYQAIDLADIAMYRSKAKGRGTVTYFSEKEVKEILKHGLLEKTLKDLESKSR